MSDEVRFVSERWGLLATSEVRWFSAGPPPDDAISWFLGLDPFLEHRVDTYEITDRLDLGVKQRGGGPLEVKALQHRDREPTGFGSLSAPVEDWLKWRPRKRAFSTEAALLAVDKTVLTSDFVAPDTGAGCEVELGMIAVTGVEAWTLAFEARGGRADRRLWLAETATRIVNGAPPAAIHHLIEALSYPDWLGAVTKAGAAHLRRR